MNLNEFLQKENCAKEFNICVGNIKVSNERNLYNALRKWYKSLAKSAQNSFDEGYKSYNNCEDIISKAEDDFKSSMAIVVEDLKDTFINLGEYDYDTNAVSELIESAGCTEIFEERFCSVAEKVYSIMGDVETQREYREQRKENRGRWQGATIGGNAITAISHQIDVGAMNMASGAAHSVANAVGNFFTEMQAESDLKKLFKNNEVKILLSEGVYYSAYSVIEVFMQTVGQDYDWGYVEDCDSEKAQRLINNLKSNSIASENISKICIDVLSLNPYNIEIYDYLLKNYGDDGSLSTLAEYFDIDGFSAIKESMALDYVKKNQGTTEEDAVKAKHDLIEYCKNIRLDITDESECITYINSVLDDFDLKYRTVDGVVCETRESADFSRSELPDILEFMKQIQPLKSNPILPYENDLLAKKEKFINTFSSEVSKKHLETINTYLSDFDKQFCKTKLFSSVPRKQAAKDRALSYAKGLRYSTIEEFDREYEKYKDFIIKNLGVNIDEAVEAKEYLEKKRKHLSSPYGGIGGFGGFFHKRK